MIDKWFGSMGNIFVSPFFSWSVIKIEKV